MGFTLPRKYGGLNCPNLIYTMAIEIISRADASLMNLFGLQGIAETIYAFANDAIKDDTLPRFCPRRSDRRDGADRARRRQRPAGRAPAGLPGREGQLVPQRRETVHHQRLRRNPAGAGPQRAGDHRRPRAEPVLRRALANAFASGTWRVNSASTARPRANWFSTTPRHARRRAPARPDHLCVARL